MLKRRSVSVALTLMLATATGVAGVVRTGEIVTDQITGLTWLPLSQTRGMSLVDVTAETQPGGSLDQWQVATVAQVLQLWADAGLTNGLPDDCLTFSPCNRELNQVPYAQIFSQAPVAALVAMMGADNTGAFGLTSSLYGGPDRCGPYRCYDAPGIFFYPAGAAGSIYGHPTTIYDEAILFGYAGEYAPGADWGVWMVDPPPQPDNSEVPEPAGLIVVGLLGLAYRRISKPGTRTA